MKKLASNIQKTTLGDLDSLSNLKDEMTKNEAAGRKEALDKRESANKKAAEEKAEEESGEAAE